MNPRRPAFFATFLFVLLCSASTALAQTVTGNIPRVETPLTWQRPDGGCSGVTPVNQQTRRFNVVKFVTTGAGNYTMTATRSDGGFIALDQYGNNFFPSAGFECSNRNNFGAPSGMGSVSDTFSCSGPICSSGSFEMEVVISVGAAETVPISFTISGGPAVSFRCGTDNQGYFTPTSSTFGSAAGSGSATYSPGSSLGCSTRPWTATSTGWITGVPASGTGPATFNFNVAANGTGSTRNGSITVTRPNGFFTGIATHSVQQTGAPACTYAFSPTSESIGAAAGSDSFSMTAGSGCAWTTSESTSWITGVTASGTASGTISYSYGANIGPARSGTITSQGQTYTANQANGCTISLTPATASPAAAAGTGSVAIDVSDAACQWTLSSNQAFVSGLSATSGTGDATVTYNIAANTGLSRSATLTGAINGNSNSDTQVITQSNGCTIALSPATASPSAAGGAGSTTLTTGSNCGWTLGSSAGFVSGFATSGTGSATINYSTAANTAPARSATLTATLTVGGATDTHVVNQANGCTAMVSPTTITTDGSAHTENVTLTMSNAACTFTTSTTGGFITPSPSSGTGSQTIGLQLTANTGATRSGTATIAGQVVTVNQGSSCTVSVTPATNSVGAAAGSSSFDITAPTGCAWTVASSAGFLTGFTASGSGSATVPYSYSANPGLVRSGTLTATLTSTGATDTHVVDQAIGCTSTVSTSTVTADGTAHTENVTLTMSDAACPFTVSSGDSWITPAPTSGTGTTTIGLALAVNSGVARSGTATLNGDTVTINQASVCTVSVDPVANVGAAVGSGSFALTTQAGCGWTIGSSAGFVSGFSASGTGPATIDYDYAGNVGVGRSATLTVTLAATSATASHTVNQASGCTASLAEPSTEPSEASGAGSVGFTMSDAACPWSASSDASWLTLPTPSGTGDGTLDFDFEANVGPERIGTITIGGATFEVTQASGCVVTVAASQAIVSSAGTGSVAVDTEPGCTWTASTTTPWLSNVTASGTGDAAISFDYESNVGSDRTGVITVSSSTTASTDSHDVVQGNGCVAMLSAAGDSFGAGAMTSSVMLTVSAADCTWSATSSDAWLTLDAGSVSGTGSATIGFSVADNVSVDRTATLTIAGQTFAVDQDSGCAIALTPTGGTATAAGGTLSFDLATDAACAWTAAESIDWISGLTASGTGPATIMLTADANVGPMRDGDVVFTATDTGAMATYDAAQSDGCVATLASDTLSAGAAAESGSVGVTFSSQSCAWTATADAFITVTNGSGTGDATLMFDVAANAGPERTGTITVLGATYTITQENGCTIVLAPDSASEESAAGTMEVEVQTAAGCTWGALATSDWITGFDANGSGPATLDVDFSENTGPQRVGTIEVGVSSGATASFVLTQGDGCAITLPVDAADAPAAGGESSFAVMTGDGCDYELEVDVSWIEASISDTGIAYEVAEWDGAERVAEIIVTSTTTDSSATFTVTQASGCSLMLTPGDVRVSADGETVSFDVTTGSGCTIGATTESDFISDITIEEGTVEAEIAENEGEERMGIIVVTAGDSMGEFVVQQDGAEDVTPDGGVEDGGITIPDGGITIPDGGITIPDGGFDFDDLQVGGGCSCHVTGNERSVPNGFGALLVGLVLAWRIGRRRKR